jgi:hypothetical protein
MSINIKLRHALAAAFRPFTKMHPEEAEVRVSGASPR